MAKTPGTHRDDDPSQQPRQKETPSKTERSAVAKEDHTKARGKLANEERNATKKHGAPR